MMRILRWFGSNFSTFLLAFFLALTVWVSAVLAQDPNVTKDYPDGVPLTIISPDEGLVVMNELPARVSLRLRAPDSVWDAMTGDAAAVQAQVDLRGLPAGEHQVTVDLILNANPVRVIEAPESITISIEALQSRQFTITPVVLGDPAQGYVAGLLILDFSQVTLTAPQSVLTQVDRIQAVVDIDGAREDINVTIPLQPVDAEGQVVSGVSFTPESLSVYQTISQATGFRDVAVKVLLQEGSQPAEGYRVSNISVTPLVVTIQSENPDLVNQLPGFVETLPIDISGASDDIEIRVALNLSEGITLLGEQTVLVQIGIAAYEGSLTVTLPVEANQLVVGLQAQVSPETVDVILAGPEPILNSLQEGDVRAYVDLTDLEIGSYQVEVQIEILREELRVESIIPASIEVIISVAPTPTINPNATLPPNPTPTPNAAALPVGTRPEPA